MQLLFNTKKRRPSQRKKTKKILKRAEMKFQKILKKSLKPIVDLLKKLWIPYINPNFGLSVLIAKWNSNIRHLLKIAITHVRYVANILLWKTV